jgi:hypothetical protein
MWKGLVEINVKWMRHYISTDALLVIMNNEVGGSGRGLF